MKLRTTPSAPSLVCVSPKKPRMLALLYTCILLTGVLVLPTSANVVQNDWLSPALPDLSTTITLGEPYTLRWDEQLYTWFAQYAPDADVTNVDLWVTTSNTAVNDASKNPDAAFPLQTGVNVNTTQSYAWAAVSISIAQLSISTDWTFRFLPSGNNYTIEPTQQVSSPQMIVQNNPSSPSSNPSSSAVSSSAASSSAASSSAVSTATAASTATTTTAPSSVSSSSSVGGATATVAPTSQHSSSGLSGGTIAGIVIGSIAVVVLALGFLLFKRRSQPNHAQRDIGPAAGDGYALHDYKSYQAQSSPLFEADSTSRYQADSTGRYPAQRAYLPPSELPGAEYR